MRRNAPHWRRDAFFWRLLRPIAALIARRAMRFSAGAAPETPGPCLIIANHNSGWDPVLVGSSFREPMYFVMGEHMLRKGALSVLIRFLFSPITRVKGATDGGAALGIMRTLKAGKNVCLFAEGNMSFSGRTGEIHPTVGRLAKRAGATVVTCRLSGVYLARPRWSEKRRKGKTRCEIVGVYPPEKLKAMTAEEIQRAVTDDLYEDAFEAQRREMTPYRGPALAEKLETALYLCPQCRGRATMESEGDRFFCTACGLSVTYGEYGFFEGGPFETVALWDDWQRDELRRIVESEDGEIFSDEKQTLSRVNADHTTEKIADGTLTLSREGFTLGGAVFPIEAVAAMDIHGRETVVFSSGGKNYEIGSPYSRSGRKYVDAYRILIGAPTTI